jgi:hypothetical protein
VARLRADPEGPRAWLVDLDPGVGTAGGAGERDDERLAEGTNEVVCARHADALVASEGWTVRDERRRRARSEPSVAGPRRAPDGAPAPAHPQRLDLRRAPAAAAVDDLLDAHSPLLRRAFAKSREA